jgi:hypothetical protein
MAKPRNITLENVNIVFRNFSGAEGPFNKAGDRNFGLLVDPERRWSAMVGTSST